MRHLARTPEAGFDPEDAAIRHLRSYSNYLTPRLGLFSGDTWATFATVLRNIFLNWLVFVPLLAAILLIPVGAREVVMAAGVTAHTQWLLVALGAGLGALATGYIGFDLPSAGNARKPYTWYLWLCLLPIVLSAIHLTTFWSWLGSRQSDAQWWDVVALGWDGVTWMHFGVLGGMMHGLSTGPRSSVPVVRRPEGGRVAVAQYAGGVWRSGSKSAGWRTSSGSKSAGLGAASTPSRMRTRQAVWVRVEVSTPSAGSTMSGSSTKVTSRCQVSR
jgi:hypothetical protein